MGREQDTLLGTDADAVHALKLRWATALGLNTDAGPPSVVELERATRALAQLEKTFRATEREADDEVTYVSTGPVEVSATLTGAVAELVFGPKRFVEETRMAIPPDVLDELGY